MHLISLYKLRDWGGGDLGRPLCWGGISVVVFLKTGCCQFSEVVAGVVGSSGVTPASSGPPPQKKTKKQRRLVCVLQSFRGVGFVGLIPC